jgi:hypothetical protein
MKAATTSRKGDLKMYRAAATSVIALLLTGYFSAIAAFL